MKSSFLLSPQTTYALKCAGWRTIKRTVLIFFGMYACQAALMAQQPASAQDSDQQTIRILLQRIDRLEARVSELESAGHATPPATTAPTPTSATTPTSTTTPASATVQTPAQAEKETEQQASEHSEPERMDVSKTLLRIRGFGDINLHGDNHKGDTTSFNLGQLNLFVTSDISEKFKFLGEIVFEAGPDNIFGVTRGEKNNFAVDVERYLLQYSYKDYLTISAGRYHTAIGYYNTAYHHSTWFQTTTGRPFLFDFEDRGGILPIHTVGVSATGLIPSGPLGLHYVAEIGNGRASRTPLQDEPVQNEIDDQNRKAFNLGLFARPDAVRGLQVGFSVYRDVLAPTGAPRVGETIVDTYAVLTRPNFEWLNEMVVVRHAPLGLSHVYSTPGFYTQISKRYKAYRPYFRYQYVNASDNDPVFPDIGLRHGPSMGLRYDASESVALKLQYDYTAMRRQPATSGLGLQVGFTF